jgi:hypothetical protein
LSPSRTLPEDVEPSSRRLQITPTASRRFGPLLLVIGAVAFVTRLGIMVHGGGLRSFGGYDDGVYYAAADALVHGRLPYRDFLLLHPPGLLLALAPFAWIGSVTSDATGLELGRLAFELIGAVSAVLVAVLLRPRGLAAAAAGGLGYAIFMPAVYAERSTLLEPLGTLGLLVALVLLLRRPAGTRAVVLAGIALGLTLTVKIWYVVPVAVVLAYGVLVLRGRSRWLLPAGAAAGALVVYLPFFASAPGPMWRYVVTDQLGRSVARNATLGSRLERIFAVPGHIPPALAIGVTIIFVLATGLIAALAVVLTRQAELVLFVALLVATVGVLLQTPSFFGHYTTFSAAPLALVIGASVGVLRDRVGARAATVAAVVVVAGVAVLAAPSYLHRRVGSTLHGQAVQAAVGRVNGCVMADDPTILALLDTLSRDLDRGCPLWPDVTGWTYEARISPTVHGVRLSRPRNPIWQSAIVRYLTSGDAYLRVRSNTGLSAESRQKLREGQVLARSGKVVLRATPGRSAR